MQIVIADTGPINYLVLIGHIYLLPALFQRILVPPAVHKELTSQKAPTLVRQWLASNPSWLELCIESVDDRGQEPIMGLDPGETEAIQLAVFLHADLLLMDDRRGVMVAKRKGLLVTGTLGLLDLAAERKLINFEQALHLLEETNFRRPQEIVDILLAKHKKLKASS